MEARVGARSVRSPLLAVVLTFLLATALSLALVLVPALRLSVRIPRFDVAIEAAGAMVALLAVALAYLRYSLSGHRLWVFVGVAFLVLGSNRAVFGIFVPAERIGPRLALFIWAAGRLIGAGLFLAGAFADGRPPDPPGQAARRFARTALWWMAVLIAVDAALWALGDDLPALTTEGAELPPERIPGVLPGLTAVDIGLGLVGTVAYLVAAVAFVRRMQRGEETPRWLPPALVLAAFSHVHYALLPTVFTSRLSTGDLLRLAFSVAVLLGLARDVSRTYATERDRSERLATAYADERRRVEQLEEADRARAQLFELLTHELMHPVSSIRGLSVTLARVWESLDDETRREFVSRIDRETDRLRALAESAATAADFERQAFAVIPRPLPAVQLVQEAAESSEGLRGRLNVRVEVEPTALVLADLARVQQVFRNLLSNAQKYAPEGEIVELSVERLHGEVVFSVVDRGPGIEPREHARLFRRFS
ncbi:MAG TPA: ATP-binding protein, partial [Actinomycetota bacterium]|nr:ATP-binding protein [Actinomycetota bacterium]